ncbi:hypothetical protein Goarm_003338 [Gossypium armourianum]|uniref:Uncharacterized protein n=1 Tax=Gossypium armourianum TaxID=34283 RepID=A0A7J9K2W2_9ROSI|nr:hypothetical protein [Gossypium armourianum]
MLSASEGRLTNFKKSMGDLKETLEIKKNNALKAMVMTLKEHVAELKGELTICKVALSNGMLDSGSKQHRMDVLKLKEFEGMRFTNEKQGGIMIGTWEEYQKEFKK